MDQYYMRLDLAAEAYWLTFRDTAGIGTPAFYDICDRLDVAPDDLEDLIWETVS